jgi:hypothetical protein
MDAPCTSFSDAPFHAPVEPGHEPVTISLAGEPQGKGITRRRKPAPMRG